MSNSNTANDFMFNLARTHMLKLIDHMIEQVETGKASDGQELEGISSLRKVLEKGAELGKIENPVVFANVIVGYLLFHMMNDFSGGKASEFLHQLAALADGYEAVEKEATTKPMNTDIAIKDLN